MKILKFNTKYFILFTISFIVFTVIGTLSHEYGHILVAENYGYKTYLHYGSTGSDINKDYKKLNKYHEKNKLLILSKETSKEKTKFTNWLNELNRKSFWITFGGPTQTILTGFLGLLILYLRKDQNQFVFIDWLAVFLSLFWLREVFNLATGLFNGLVLKGNYFGGDEYFLSIYLSLPAGTVSIILGLIGLGISLFIIYKIIPRCYRLTFIISGLIGGFSGFYLWYNIFGPKLLPLY